MSQADRLPKGFTLIEVVVAVLVLGSAAAAMVILVGVLFVQRDQTHAQHQGVALMQECAERILMTRRGNVYASLNPNICSTVVDMGFDPPTVVVGTPYAGPPATPGTTNPTSCTLPAGCCPRGRVCTPIRISISKTGGPALAPVQIQFVDYNP